MYNMELLNLRISSYKGLSGIDLNFSNRIRFNFQEKENSIEIIETEIYMDKVFGNNINTFMGSKGLGFLRLPSKFKPAQYKHCSN